MPKLIGIAGKAGSGKDAIADHLWEHHSFLKMAFADALKLSASSMFGIDLNYFYDRDKKEERIEYWGLSPRQIAQLLGTEAVRGVFGDDFWVRRWYLSFLLMKDTDHVVVPDVRFELEAEFIRRLGGTILHVRRPTAGLQGMDGLHVSERGIRHDSNDLVIDNDGTLDDLYSKADQLPLLVKDCDWDGDYV